jgi:hypothetical protein
MPIRVADRRQPKYRMIHATNHPDGCVLMAENIANRTDDLHIHLPAHAQGALFGPDAGSEPIDPAYLREHMSALLSGLPGFTDAQEIMADFYGSRGVICKPDAIRGAWAEMEASGQIQVDRQPQLTPTGKPSTFWSLSKGKTLRIRSNRAAP